ncbi:MAG TPA: alpha/beta hydrolase [Pseudonocardiaceae bacterium]|nr:alpha/beta hydrolase [Pseudonocardiaceae bacterium]
MNTRFLTVPGGQLAYDDTETAGPVVLCVHGMGETRGVYRFLRPALVAAGYRVITTDLRGCGESTAKWDDYSTVAVAGDLIALARAVTTEPVTLVAHSYTGGPAFLVAARAPELCSALVLINAVARPQPKMKFYLRPAAWFVGHFAMGWVAYWSSLFKSAKPVDFADYRAALLANLREPGRTPALAAMMADPQRDGADAAADVRCPVLVLMGTEDTDFPDPAEEARATAAMVADGRFQLVEGSGHYAQVEFPDVVAGAILPFLEKSGTHEHGRSN